MVGQHVHGGLSTSFIGFVNSPGGLFYHIQISMFKEQYFIEFSTFPLFSMLWVNVNLKSVCHKFRDQINLY